MLYQHSGSEGLMPISVANLTKNFFLFSISSQYPAGRFFDAIKFVRLKKNTLGKQTLYTLQLREGLAKGFIQIPFKSVQESGASLCCEWTLIVLCEERRERGGGGESSIPFVSW